MKTQAVKFSFEFFPALGALMESRLHQAMDELSVLDPVFSSMTWGAGGKSGSDIPKYLVPQLAQKHDHPIAGHISCFSQTKGEYEETLDRWWEQGVRNLVVVRGDIPHHAALDAYPADHYYGYADELLVAVKSKHDFFVNVAAYPERYPESVSQQQDFDVLKRKQDLGADQAITQFFFNPDDFLKFRDEAVNQGITIPIVPGILAFTNVVQALNFAKKSGVSVPKWFEARFAQCGEDEELRELVALNTVNEQCNILQAEGVDHFHFFTLNKWRNVKAICQSLLSPTLSREVA